MLQRLDATGKPRIAQVKIVFTVDGLAGIALIQVEPQPRISRLASLLNLRHEWPGAVNTQADKAPTLRRDSRAHPVDKSSIALFHQTDFIHY